MLLSFLFLAFWAVIPPVQTRNLPSFQELQSHYPGDPRYGGVYDTAALLELTEVEGRLSGTNDTCPLRLSTALNYLPAHRIIKSRLAGISPNLTLNGTGVFYFFKDNMGMISWLLRVYGEPEVTNATRPFPFRGRQGIMYLDVDNEPEDCRILLWDGMGFHQARGFIHHKNLKRVFFWETPADGCGIDINLKQGGTCFPGRSSVELLGGEKVPMGSLKIGDRVKTLTAEGRVVYSPVVTFLDQMPDYGGYYHTIITDTGANVSLSEAHLIFRKERSRGMAGLLGFQAPRAAYAADVRPDDVIFVFCPRAGAVVPQKVLGVALAQQKGAFAPVTEEGTLLVDGVWVSCYADIGDHQLAHYLMTPLRSFYGLAPQVLGAGGGYMHGYLKGVLRPIGTKILGEGKFYKGQKW